jgi:hypothetical protein
VEIGENGVEKRLIISGKKDNNFQQKLKIKITGHSPTS